MCIVIEALADEDALHLFHEWCLRPVVGTRTQQWPEQEEARQPLQSLHSSREGRAETNAQQVSDKEKRYKE